MPKQTTTLHFCHWLIIKHLPSSKFCIGKYPLASSRFLPAPPPQRYTPELKAECPPIRRGLFEILFVCFKGYRHVVLNVEVRTVSMNRPSMSEAVCPV